MSKITEIPLGTKTGAADLSSYAGQVLLIVNTASNCGFTPQDEIIAMVHAHRRSHL